eukprot:2275494-Pleurochrysis_carterae.AAC.1
MPSDDEVLPHHLRLDAISLFCPQIGLRCAHAHMLGLYRFASRPKSSAWPMQVSQSLAHLLLTVMSPPLLVPAR